MYLARKAPLAAIALLLAGLAAPALAETLVVRASGPSAAGLAPGKKLAEAGRLTLKAGDVVTLLDGRGTRTLRGPGTFAVTGAATAGSDSRNGLTSLLEAKQVRRARTGAVRGPGAAYPTAARSPNLWYVDVSQSSTICVTDPANVRLWRPDIARAETIAITPAKGRAATPVLFAGGEAVVNWPAALPVADGAVYRLSWAGQARPVEIRFAILGASAGGLETMASTLIAHQCSAQLDLLVETVALPDPKPETPAG